MYCSLCKKKLPRKGFVHYYHKPHPTNSDMRGVFRNLPVHTHCKEQHEIKQKILKAAGHIKDIEPYKHLTPFESFQLIYGNQIQGHFGNIL